MRYDNDLIKEAVENRRAFDQTGWQASTEQFRDQFVEPYADADGTYDPMIFSDLYNADKISAVRGVVANQFLRMGDGTFVNGVGVYQHQVATTLDAEFVVDESGRMWVHAWDFKGEDTAQLIAQSWNWCKDNCASVWIVNKTQHRDSYDQWETTWTFAFESEADYARFKVAI